MGKYVIEGWIRARLTYLTSDNVGIDQFSYFSSHFKEFGNTASLRNLRVKVFIYSDKDTGITFSAYFAYDQIGIQFCAETQEKIDSIEAFKGLVEKGVKGYRSFKDYFLKEICPSNIQIEFNWEALLLSLYGFIKKSGSQTKERAKLDAFVDFLKKYTSEPEEAIFSKGLGKPKPPPSIEQIKIETMADVMKAQDDEFYSVFLTLGEENAFDIKHHLSASSFFLHDMSSDLNTVAKWGFNSSLFLTDFHIENEEFSSQIEALRKSAKEACEKKFAFGSDTLQETLTTLEKKSRYLDEELQEFETLSTKIYSAINENEQSDRIFEVLNSVESLPHSLSFAYGVLKLRELGVFKGYKSVLDDIRLDLNIVDIKLRHFELYTVISLVILLSIIVPIGYYVNKDVTDGLLSPIANILQILTFVVAVMLLALRQRKR
jgi:hypothetical protein